MSKQRSDKQGQKGNSMKVSGELMGSCDGTQTINDDDDDDGDLPYWIVSRTS